MNKINAAVFSTCLLMSAVAFAQSNATRGEMLNRSAEMMVPPGLAASVLSPATPSMAPRIGDADRMARETITNTDKMRPALLGTPTASDQTPMASTMSEADRKMAESIRRTDQMRPN